METLPMSQGDLSPDNEAHDYSLNRLGAVRSRDALRDWLKADLAKILPQHGAVILFGRIHALGVNLTATFATDLPETYSRALLVSAKEIESPLLERWLVVRKPISYSSASNTLKTELPLGMRWEAVLGTFSDDVRLRNWCERLIAHGIASIVVDGMCASDTNDVVILKLYNLPREVDPAITSLLQRLLPELINAWRRIQADEELRLRAPKVSLEALSDAEREIALWVARGKTNAEIAIILNKSAGTVKNQVQAVLRKLGMENRASLAASFAAGAYAERHIYKVKRCSDDGAVA